MRTKEELEDIAVNALSDMPINLTPSELAYIIASMLKGHALALKNRGM